MRETRLNPVYCSVRPRAKERMGMKITKNRKTNNLICTKGTWKPLRIPTPPHEPIITRTRFYFASPASGFVSVVVVASAVVLAAMSGEAPGCSVTAPSPPPSLPSPLPFCCFLGEEEPATRFFRASSSKASSSVASPQSLQHPRWVDPARDPRFSVPGVI